MLNNAVIAINSNLLIRGKITEYFFSLIYQGILSQHKVAIWWGFSAVNMTHSV
jgi:hypothetical protein